MKINSIKTAENKKLAVQSIIEKAIELKDQELNKYLLLLQNGQTIYLPANFDFDFFTQKLTNYVESKLELSVEIKKEESGIVIIKYTKSKGLLSKINLNDNFFLILGKYEDSLLSLFYKEDQLAENELKPQKFKLSNLVNNQFQPEITKFIQDYILSEISGKEYFREIINENILNQEIDENFLIWFYTQKTEEEILLSKLNIDSIEKYNSESFVNKGVKAYFIQTEIENIVVAFNEKNEIILFEKIAEKLKSSSGLLKNTITSEKIIFTTQRTNKAHFGFAETISLTEKTEKIRLTAVYNKQNKSDIAAEKFVTFLIINFFEITDELALFYLKIINNSTTKKEDISQDYNIIEISQKLVSDKDFAKKIDYFFATWTIQINEKSAFTDIFANLATTQDQRNIVLPFYEKFAEEFVNSTKNEIDKTLSQINLCKFLIQCNELLKAKTILEKLLSKIPDETLSELIPDENIDITGDKSGKLLKITIYDLLAQTVEKSKKEEYILEAAKLQPLNIERLRLLKESENKNISEKAEKLISIFEEPEILKIQESEYQTPSKILSEKTINEILQYQATRKNETFYSIQKWLSKVKPVDYNYVKAYAEKITAQNNNELYVNLTAIKKSLIQDNIEFYISKGDKSIGITGYESNPPFVIIGHEHLNPELKNYFSKKMLYFFAASEIAHIYFKHSRITSADVWRGAADKGFFIMDSLLSIVPAASFIEKSLENIKKLNGLTKILAQTKKIKSGKEIIDHAIKISKFYTKITNTDIINPDKQKLLAVSRMMQFTADRTGMIFSGDIKESVKAIILSNQNNTSLIEEIKKYGLRKTLSQTDQENKFKYQHIALRVSNIFSFYLSNDYKTITEELKK
jgi:hypothetical protein